MVSMIQALEKGASAIKSKIEVGGQNPVFEIEVSETSSMLTHIAFNPNREVIEDRYKLTKFQTKQL
jgi:hypothetical protein